jgi:hypothetical protein
VVYGFETGPPLIEMARAQIHLGSYFKAGRTRLLLIALSSSPSRHRCKGAMVVSFG